jgi:hypothetical protein
LAGIFSRAVSKRKQLIAQLGAVGGDAVIANVSLRGGGQNFVSPSKVMRRAATCALPFGVQ